MVHTPVSALGVGCSCRCWAESSVGHGYLRGIPRKDASISGSRHMHCDHHARAWAHTRSQGNLRYTPETPFCLRVGHLLPYSMSDSNTTDFTNPSTFILLGIPGLETAHIWISIPFCTMYAIAVLGNFTILFIVKTKPILHGPMYYFLCMLAISDLVISTSIVPKMLSIFWFNSREIDFSACLTQMYFIHCFLVMDSGILVAMALDRYVAICDPLRYSTILTKPMVAMIGLAVVLRGGMLILPYPFLARQWPYCRTAIIPHTYCEHMAVVKLACADIRISSYYSLSVAFLVTGLDVFFIAVSYIQILRAIFSLPTKDARLKTFGTCGSHLCVILVSYIPALFSSLMHRFGHNVALHFHILMANVYLLVPTMLHPIIYGVRTKQIRNRLLQLLTYKGM
ncbi:putative olfactory receptor 52P1 [Chelonia mydas]|uniref:putative olfactory receptor 52P1 n=1 Tax=Chelonia mydas TaxID=8469 RepID=UPI001CA8B754|nr:putative olfactory receptor 52P1 [Chelonia mydas]